MTYKQEIQTLIGQFLKELYKRTGGNWHKECSFNAIRNDLHWEDERTSEVVEYLREQGLIQYAAMGQIQLSQAGVDACQPMQPEKTRAKIGF